MDSTEQNHHDPHHAEDHDANRLSRRAFFKRAGVVGAAAGTAALTAGCGAIGGGASAESAEVSPTATPIPTRQQYPAVPATPLAPPPASILNFFTFQEARTVDALSARILPGSPDDPGAREAGVVIYIDNVLAHQDGFAQPVYRMPPFAETYEGSSLPAAAQSANYQVIWVAKDQIDRYGYQSILTPREMYRKGLASLDSYANSKFGKDFVDLSADQQDTIVGDLADGKASNFSDPSAQNFFKLVRKDIVEGMFADPLYGGNRDMVGWKLIGYPGIHRAYTPLDIQTEGTRLPLQSIANMPRFNPGQRTNPDVVLPVSGSDQQQ